ncbi:MAG: hypothetical protein QOH35_5023, partial [Acidobacteriaceae bacterium]|nr:hypothetical protein [Acidobacteriaceae bacterium]
MITSSLDHISGHYRVVGKLEIDRAAKCKYSECKIASRELSVLQIPLSLCLRVFTPFWVLAMMHFTSIWEKPCANTSNRAEPRHPARPTSGAFEAAWAVHVVELSFRLRLAQTHDAKSPMRRHGL